MAKRVAKRPDVKRFEIKDDEEIFDPIYVVVNQASETDYGLIVERALPEFTWDDEGTASRKNRLNPIFSRRFAAYRTLGSISGLVDEDGKEIFASAMDGQIERVRAAMSESKFNEVWDILDPDLIDQIVRHVMEVNPTLQLSI